MKEVLEALNELEGLGYTTEVNENEVIYNLDLVEEEMTITVSKLTDGYEMTYRLYISGKGDILKTEECRESDELLSTLDVLEGQIDDAHQSALRIFC